MKRSRRQRQCTIIFLVRILFVNESTYWTGPDDFFEKMSSSYFTDSVEGYLNISIVYFRCKKKKKHNQWRLCTGTFTGGRMGQSLPQDLCSLTEEDTVD